MAGKPGKGKPSMPMDKKQMPMMPKGGKKGC